MRIHSQIFWGVVPLAAAISTMAQPQRPPGRRIELDDLRKIVSVSDPQISPDGKTIACVVSRPNFEENRSDREIILVNVSTRAQRPLTYNRRGASSPRWSPAGDRLAFVAQAGTGKDAHAQIFVLPMTGGDAVQLTHAPEGVEQFAWRPGGNDIAYVAPDEAGDKKEREHHRDAFEVGNNGFLETEAPTPSHIWMNPAGGGEAKRLTSGEWSLVKSAPPSSPSSPLSWSSDGKWIAFARQPRPHFGDNDRSEVEILDVASGEIRKLTTHAAFEGYGDFSPDGSRIAYWYPRDGDPNNVNEIFVAPAAGGNGANVTRAVDRNIVRAIWMPGGKSLLLGAHDGTQTSLWLLPLEGTAKRIDLGEVSPVWLFWVDLSVGHDGAIAIAGIAPNRPSELYYMASPAAAPTRLTEFNREIAALKLGAVEPFEWQAPDGFRADGVLTYPPNFARAKKYPLVLLIHGGPTAASTRTFSPRAQLMAAHDYIVFEPNYRGSDNLGNTYQRAIFNDAGDGPGRDVMAGIEALEKLGFVDSSRIAVSGWSYGGYMTAWLIGHYQIWKTAVAGAAVTNLVDQYNLADFNVSERHIFGGSPWTGDYMKAYRAQSPISYWSSMKTPTLILSDTGDARVTVTQSYELYHALKDNGVPVKFIAYPVPGHFPGDPVRAMDVTKRWIEWLDQYLK